MELELPHKQQKEIIIENNVTPIKRLLIILSFPAILALFILRIYLEETPSDPSSARDILYFSPVVAFFVFYVSYRMWKSLETKIILTNEKIIRKQPFSKEFHMSWSAIEKITIGKDPYGGPIPFLADKIYLIFTRKEREFLSTSYNHIHCPLGVEEYLSEDVANLILRNIALYQIPIKGKRELLEEISRNLTTDVLDVLSQQINAQIAEPEARQGTMAKVLKGTMARVLKVLAYIWFCLFGTLLVISFISCMLKEGFWTFAQGWSPLSILSFLFVFSPGIAALLLAKWLKKRKSPPKPMQSRV